MADLFHWFGSDLVASPNGDLQTIEGTVKGQQAVLRRLLTIAGTYIWEITYGAGLPAYLGNTTDAKTLQGIIRAQLYFEASVSQNPIPVINVTPITGGFNIVIQYVDAASGAPAVLAFNVTQ
jgi:hypothetical protein